MIYKKDYTDQIKDDIIKLQGMRVYLEHFGRINVFLKKEEKFNESKLVEAVYHLNKATDALREV
jgi:hypothetical protein